MSVIAGSYIPGHSAFVMWAAETDTITENNGTTPATLPDPPGSPALIGYTNVPEVTTKLNNKVGFAAGSATSRTAAPRRRWRGSCRARPS